jgi:putative PIN family toxin of toxin-antitoxin system
MALGSKIVSLQMQRVIETPHVAIFTSAEQLEELTDTLAKPKLQKYLTQQRTRQLLELIWQKALLVHVHTQLKICRDPKDDFLLQLALDAKAHCIVSGDTDLLALNPVGDLKIITLTDFLQML